MLVEFRFKNFRSFRDETKISMVASLDKSLLENSCKIESFGNRRLLQSAVIYGANAAGKSNLIFAIDFVYTFLTTSTDRKVDTPIDIKPFLLTKNLQSEPSEFEITFLDDEKVRYQYGFSLTSERVVREWLIAYPKGLPQTWFERQVNSNLSAGTHWYFGRNLKGQNAQIASMTRPDILFLSNAIKLNHKQLKKIYSWLQNSLRVIDATEFDPHLYIYSASKAKDDDNLKNEISRLLEISDFGIDGFDIKEEKFSELDFPKDMPNEVRKRLVNKKHLDVFLHHSIGEETVISFPLQEESSGTQRFFSMSGPLLEVLENGWTLFVDELDSSLHPLLVRYLVKLFHNSKTNPKGAQLIFNTHDITLLDNSLFRRDQIWFVEKDREGCSHLYSLLDYSPRKGEALSKGYLQGRYGAIPFLGEFDWGKAGNGEE